MTTSFGEIDAIIHERFDGSDIDGPLTRAYVREKVIAAVTDGSPSSRCDEAVARATVALEANELHRIDDLATLLLARWNREI